MKYISLIRSGVVWPFEAFMVDTGIPVERAFQHAHLPLAVRDDTDLIIPEKPFWLLLEYLRDREGLSDIGFQVGSRNPVYRTPSANCLIQGVRTLSQLLQKFVAISLAYANTPTYFLITGKTHVQFCRKPSTPIDCGGWLMEQYILFVMIDIVRLSLGMDWWPSKIGLTYDGAAQDDERHWLRDSCIITSQPHTSIDIPLLSLLAPVTIPVGQDTAPSGQHMPTDASGSVAASLTYYLSGQNTRLDRFCDILGVSPRTLQRWLAAEGVNFQSVLDSVRHQHALDLLFSGDFKIGEIASALGYTNLSAFTRAFTKWEGCPPSRRKL